MTTRQTEYGVDGTYAQRSTVAPRSSPEAAQRCADGAGLDGGDRGRGTIKCAVRRSKVHRLHRANRHFRYTSNLHHLDGRDPSKSFDRRRLRLIQAKNHSTTHRRGCTAKPT